MQAGKILSGTILQGAYVLLGPIGETGNDVFRAHHHRDRRTVAVRIWRGDAASADQYDLSVAQTAIRLRNPLLATVEACGREREGLWFIVSEYVAGQRLDQWADTVGIPPLASVLDYVHRLCLALHMVHRAGLAHCAVNPRNLVMVRGAAGAPGQVLHAKLLDLGVPAFMRSRPPRLRSALFMAPEQLAAALQPDSTAALETDSRVDVYACGCLLYYLCTGGTPFPSRSLRELSASHAESKLRVPSRINPAIPEALDAVILRALSSQPRDRYRDGAELAGALDEVRRSSSVSGVIPTVTAPEASGQEPMDEAPTILYEGDFEERPTADGAGAAALLRAEVAREALRDPAAAEPAATRDDATTERPPRASAPSGSFAHVAPPAPPPPPPPPLKVPELRAARSLPPPIAVPAPANFPPRPRPSTPASGIVKLAPPPIPALPALTDSAITRPPTTSIEPTEAAPPRHIKGRRWRHEWWLWVAAGVLSVGVYVQLERWDMPPKVHRTISVSSLRAAAPKLQPEASSAPSPAPQDVTALPRPQAEPATPDKLEPRHERARAATPTRAPVSKSPARATNAGPSPTLAHGTPSERTSIQKALSQRTISPAQRAALEAIANPGTEQTGQEPEPARENPAAPSPTDSAQPNAPNSHSATRSGDGVTEPSARAASASTGAEPSAKHSAQALAADARILELVVRGSLATSEVRRAVERIRPQLVACYMRAAKAADRNRFGEVSVEVAIDEGGRAHNSHASGGELPDLDHCVEQAAATVVSGRPPDTGTVKASWRVAFVPRAQ